MNETTNTGSIPSIPNRSVSDKYGDIRKCSVCGATVGGTLAKCPECGHEFTTIKANSTSEGLLQALENIARECARLKDKNVAINRKIQTIQNFPIPNTKDDIIEMLTLCHSNMAEKNCDPKIAQAWKLKTEQLISKAQVSLKDDKDAQFLIQKINSAKEKKSKTKKIVISSIVICILAIIIGGFIYKTSAENEEISKKNEIIEVQTKITKAIQKNDVKTAYGLVTSLDPLITVQQKQEQFEELAGNAYLKIVMSLLQDGYLQDAARVGLEYSEKLNDQTKWHESQIYQLLKNECEAQDIDTSELN